MKLFKTIDWIVQLALIVTGLLLIAFRLQSGLSDIIFFSYMAVGGWQIISVVAHFFFPAMVKIRMRKLYLILLALTILTGIIFQLIDDDNMLGFLFGLLFWSPVLALFYLITCIIETNKMKTIKTEY